MAVNDCTRGDDDAQSRAALPIATSAGPPSLLVELAYEGSPRLAVVADSAEAEQALWRWLGETPALLRTSALLLDLLDQLLGDESEAS
jgi:hypothetical protein